MSKDLKHRLKLEHELLALVIHHFGMDSSASHLDVGMHKWIESENGMPDIEAIQSLIKLACKAVELYNLDIKLKSRQHIG